MRGQSASHTLTPTALVSEVYLKLRHASDTPDDPRGLRLLAARAMRQILIDHARSKSRRRRGGGRRRITLSGLSAGGSDRVYDMLAFSEALEQLSRRSERKARLVELRVFAGLGPEECADALGVSRSTFASDWAFVRAWFRSRLSEDDRDE